MNFAPRSRPLLALIALAPCLPAQGLRWADTREAPVAHVRELANGDWMLTFDGWSTTALVPSGGDDQAAAVGVDYGARTVRATESEFIRGGEGGEAVQAAWFPFAPDPSVDAAFASRSNPLLVWSGFRAPVGTVPDHDGGALSFRVPLQGGARLSAAVFLASIGQPVAGAAHVNAQGNATGPVFLLQASAVRLADICWYKFDRGLGSDAINYAGVEGGARGAARLQNPSRSPWTDGAFGGALAAGSTCDTGFHGDIGARFTVAWFMRQGAALSGQSPVFALGNLRCFTGGVAGPGLQCSGWGGVALTLPDDIRSQAARGWVHVALVVDSDNGQATWFVNGARRQRATINTLVRVPPVAGSMLIGSSNGQTCAYDLDEFRMVAEAVPDPVIQVWANDTPAAAQAFTSACGATLRHSGVPSLGSTFEFRLEAAPSSAVGLFATGAARVPLDLGTFFSGLAGCQWHSGTTAPLFVFAVGNDGLASRLLQVPNAAELRGVELFVQGLVVEPTLTVRATNAYVLSLR
ncbi:MAG: hypothetical protein R3F56_11535 [Planctomycetota bacterium]